MGRAIKVLFNLPNFIDLDLCDRIGGGQSNYVYELPSLPGILIKTVRPDIIDGRGFNKRANRIRRKRLLGVYTGLARELKEFLVHLRRQRGMPGKLPFARPYGFVQTSQGLGFMVERISDRAGRLAPTLRDLRNRGAVGAVQMRALNEFFDRCKRDHVVLGDVHDQNIVFTDARDGEPEFVCVDGLGEKAAIPVHAMSSYLNGRRIERQRKCLLEGIGTAERQAVAGADKAEMAQAAG